MGLDGARGRSSLRFSFSILNTAAEALDAATLVKRTVEALRQTLVQDRNGGTAPSACGLSFS